MRLWCEKVADAAASPTVQDIIALHGLSTGGLSQARLVIEASRRFQMFLRGGDHSGLRPGDADVYYAVRSTVSDEVLDIVARVYAGGVAGGEAVLASWVRVRTVSSYTRVRIALHQLFKRAVDDDSRRTSMWRVRMVVGALRRYRHDEPPLPDDAVIAEACAPLLPAGGEVAGAGEVELTDADLRVVSHQLETGEAVQASWDRVRAVASHPSVRVELAARLREGAPTAHAEGREAVMRRVRLVVETLLRFRDKSRDGVTVIPEDHPDRLIAVACQPYVPPDGAVDDESEADVRVAISDYDLHVVSRGLAGGEVTQAAWDRVRAAACRDRVKGVIESIGGPRADRMGRTAHMARVRLIVGSLFKCRPTIAGGAVPDAHDRRISKVR